MANATQTIQEMFMAFGRGDMDAVFAKMSPGIVWDSRYTPKVPIHGTYRGLDAVKGLFATIFQSIEVHDFRPAEFISQGDKVVVLGSERATAKSSGKTYDNHWVHVYAVKDGQVVSASSYNDTATVEAAFSS